ncbi:hypothetical protein QWY75_11575 [Pontixanthobacter aestiaquae]|uniref:Beta/Gamma crystallin n=2 Tax=Pontixanthobacter aestiaquae TaxID=1509367 RepID=A0A844Z501_9SPHN|nr:hypothetical protein [Pontixanthobacter aestiaquae]MDN3646841.1 hypothetical protein [Pontixanthobacter aestiaquae]MXO82177.1 hypothetical protein [Pontixanthobacter aestiaquae]
MSRRLSQTLFLGIVPFLGACAATAVPPPSPGTSPNAPIGRTARVPVPSTPPRQAPGPSTTPGFQAPRIMDIPGLERVIGSDSAALQRQFGQARLDVREGDAQKLQFSGEACVLDIYLYPLAPGATPTATYVDARRSSDGLDVDRASCVAALKR